MRTAFLFAIAAVSGCSPGASSSDALAEAEYAQDRVEQLAGQVEVLDAELATATEANDEQYRQILDLEADLAATDAEVARLNQRLVDVESY